MPRRAASMRAQSSTLSSTVMVRFFMRRSLHEFRVARISCNNQHHADVCLPVSGNNAVASPSAFAAMLKRHFWLRLQALIVEHLPLPDAPQHPDNQVFLAVRLTLHITGIKKQNKERAAFFYVRVYVIVMYPSSSPTLSMQP